MNQTLKQKLKEIKTGKLTAVKNVMLFGEKIEKLNKKLNIFLIRNEEALTQAKDIDKRIKQGKQVGKLAGLCCAIKSNICVRGLVTNCGSKVLENFVAPYNASVISKLLEEDAIILGMTNMDEFACGASGETSAFGVTKNPHNPKLIPGGSSSGSAASVASDLCDFALGSDTGGSIRNPASHCNVVGFKPTYGSVSRYGLIDMTMSFDQIGPLTKSVQDAELIFNIIKGQDNFDPTTSNEFLESSKKKQSITKENTTKSEKVKTIGLVNVEKFCNKEIAKRIHEKTHEIAKEHNLKIKSVNLPLDIAIQTYYIMVFVEFFSATRKFDGRRFGFKIEDFSGPEVQRRLLGGSEISKAEYHGRYYRNALKAKYYVKEKLGKIFKDVDILVLPTVPRLAHNLGEQIPIKDMYGYDVLTVLANISGIPAISIPAGEIDKKKIGLQIMAPSFSEDSIFKIGRLFEK